jgi:hypothetical protein
MHDTHAGFRAIPGQRWLDALRWRTALLIAPEIEVAGGKRRLERIARECGVPRSAAKKIASAFFDRSRQPDADVRPAPSTRR